MISDLRLEIVQQSCQNCIFASPKHGNIFDDCAGISSPSNYCYGFEAQHGGVDIGDTKEKGIGRERMRLFPHISDTYRLHVEPRAADVSGDKRMLFNKIHHCRIQACT